MGAETSEMRPAGHWSRPEGATAGSRAQLRIASVALHVPCVGCEIDTSTRARASADTRHRTATERRILDR